MRLLATFTASLCVSLFYINSVHAERPVGITADLMSVTVKHNGKEVDIQRIQDNKHVLEGDYALTSRPCPPFCVQPDTLGEGIETIAELGMLNYLKQVTEGDENILVIDSRTPDWVKRGTIPGSVNIPWSALSPNQGAETDDIITLMEEQFGVTLKDGEDSFSVDEKLVAGQASEAFDYSQAKTLVLFCNGLWCGQSPANIRTLSKFGYPPEKLKWYRGGMQDWKILGLTVVEGTQE